MEILFSFFFFVVVFICRHHQAKKNFKRKAREKNNRKGWTLLGCNKINKKKMIETSRLKICRSNKNFFLQIVYILYYLSVAVIFLFLTNKNQLENLMNHKKKFFCFSLRFDCLHIIINQKKKKSENFIV